METNQPQSSFQLTIKHPVDLKLAKQLELSAIFSVYGYLDTHEEGLPCWIILLILNLFMPDTKCYKRISTTIFICTRIFSKLSIASFRRNFPTRARMKGGKDCNEQNVRSYQIIWIQKYVQQDQSDVTRFAASSVTIILLNCAQGRCAVFIVSDAFRSVQCWRITHPLNQGRI